MLVASNVRLLDEYACLDIVVELVVRPAHKLAVVFYPLNKGDAHQ